VATVKVAHRNMSDFAPHDLFYVATGSEDSTASEYKRAKRLLIGGGSAARPLHLKVRTSTDHDGILATIRASSNKSLGIARSRSWR